MKNKIACILLAAGRGERMKSPLPKALHPVCGRPMIAYSLDVLKGLRVKETVAVLGFKRRQVKRFLDAGKELRVKTAVQEKLLGTADAVRRALPRLSAFRGTVLILCVDTPLVRKETLRLLIEHHVTSGCDATVLTAKMENPSGYGRITRDAFGTVCRIVEEKDADDFQKDIKEISTGVMCFKKEKLIKALKSVRLNRRKGEYYLTDAIGILYKDGGVIDGIPVQDPAETLGINSCAGLAQAGAVMQKRINEKHLDRGVVLTDPASTHISYDAQIGPGTVIYPFTVIERNVTIGKRCFVGPFAHLREGTRIGNDTVAGNFLELVRARIGSRCFLKHFGYIGDSTVGNAVNIGAGSVTANFDGVNKHCTTIRGKAFIGSDTVMVAPVDVGKGAKTGAGSVLLKGTRVPAHAVVVGVPAKPVRKKKTHTKR